jgi:hypothetical protein
MGSVERMQADKLTSSCCCWMKSLVPHRVQNDEAPVHASYWVSCWHGGGAVSFIRRVRVWCRPGHVWQGSKLAEVEHARHSLAGLKRLHPASLSGILQRLLTLGFALGLDLCETLR